jgi:hypothetical protein
MRSPIDNGVGQGRQIGTTGGRQMNPPAERTPLDTGACWILIGLLSVALWAAIWAALASLI